MTMCDDIFDDSDGDDRAEDLLWQKTRKELTKEGFREGLDVGQDEKLQEGFNQGFSESAQQLFPIAELRGQINALMSYNLLKKKELDPNVDQKLQDLLEEINTLEKAQLTLCKDSSFIETRLKNKESRDQGETSSDSDAFVHQSYPPFTNDLSTFLQTLKQRLKDIV